MCSGVCLSVTYTGVRGKSLSVLTFPERWAEATSERVGGWMTGKSYPLEGRGAGELMEVL